MDTGEILTITELNQHVRDILESDIGMVWIQGEISNLSRPSSGHWYFSLKDSEAQVRCCMFANRNRKLDFEPEHGQHILAYGLVSLYEARGDFQLIVEKMEAIGDGNLQQEFEKLAKKLAADGLFDSKYKKQIPEHPRSIGIITSPTGAAVRDILNVLKRRAPDIPVIIYPTAVQGNLAALQIVDAIMDANQHKSCDVLILARGGGSLEDLWSFNEEMVARAIFASEIPIVSGIGHEIDFTIADWVADIRAPTPSAAAELVTPDHSVYKIFVNETYHRLIQLINQKITYAKDNIEHLQKRLKHPAAYLQQLRQQIDYHEVLLTQQIQSRIKDSKQQLHILANALQTLSPLATLSRGYVIAFDEEQQVISSAKDVKPKQALTLKWHNGEKQAIIQEKKQE